MQMRSTAHISRTRSFARKMLSKENWGQIHVYEFRPHKPSCRATIHVECVVLVYSQAFVIPARDHFMRCLVKTT
jgi:hypothetical protein